MTMMAEQIRPEDVAPGWTKASGEWATRDGRFSVPDSGDGSWWLVENTPNGEQWIEPFEFFRDLKARAAAIYAEEIEKTNDLLLEVDEIESGDGTIFRLRLRDGWNNTFAEAYVRRGKVGIEPGFFAGADADPDKANGLAAMLQQAAALAETQREEER